MASLDKLRIDSTVVASPIAPPSDSQLLNDGVRVISRLLAKSKTDTGLKVRFTDKRKAAKSLAFRIFNAKQAVKNELYPELLKIARRVVKQADRGHQQVIDGTEASAATRKWLQGVCLGLGSELQPGSAGTTRPRLAYGLGLKSC